MKENIAILLNKKLEQPYPARVLMLVAGVANHRVAIATNSEEPRAWIEAMVMLGVGYSGGR